MRKTDILCVIFGISPKQRKIIDYMLGNGNMINVRKYVSEYGFDSNLVSDIYFNIKFLVERGVLKKMYLKEPVNISRKDLAIWRISHYVKRYSSIGYAYYVFDIDSVNRILDNSIEYLKIIKGDINE